MTHVPLYTKISRYKKVRITCHYTIDSDKLSKGSEIPFFFLKPLPTALDGELVPSAPMPTHTAKQDRQVFSFYESDPRQRNSPLAWANAWTLWHQLSTAV